MSRPAPSSPFETERVLSLEQVRALIEPRRLPPAPLAEKVQVVIVGAGPAGLTAANLLGKLGVDTLLLEAKPATSDQPKAIAIDDEYMRLLVHLGLGPTLEPHVSAPFGIWFMGANHEPVIKVAGSKTPNGFGRRCAVMQPVLEQILLTGASSHSSVRVRYDTRVDALSQSEDSVEVRIGGDIVRCDYLLACDGVRSSIRSTLGINFEGTHIDEPHLVIDLANFPDQSPFSRFFCDPRRPLNSVPSVYGGRRIEFMLNPDDDHDHLVTDEGVRELIDRHTPYKGMKLDLVRRAIYGFAEKIADRLQDRRVFLLGDAAHVMPPFGGQGMNTAARDANNLCWKIAEVLNGSAAERLLETYDPERRPQISAIVKYSVIVGQFANIRSRPLAFLRDTFLRLSQYIPSVRRFFGQMRYMPRPRISQGILLTATEPRFNDYIGVTLPRWKVRVDGELSSIDELAGDGFCLVGIGVAAAALRNAARHPLWDKRAPRLVALNEPGASGAPDVSCVDFEDDLMELAHLRGGICVVRPDRYVATVVMPSLAPAVFDSLAKLLASEISPGFSGRARPRPNQEAIQ